MSNNRNVHIMKLNKVIFKLFVCTTLFSSILSCHRTDINTAEEPQGVMDPAYEELLNSIGRFEQEDLFVKTAPTRKKGWGLVVAADAIPVLLGTGFGGVGIFGGTVLGIMNSFFIALFDRDQYATQEWIGVNCGVDWVEEFVKMKGKGTENTEMVGAVHNAVLQQLLLESESTDYSEVSDWELFEIIEQKVVQYLDSEPSGISQTQFQQLMQSFPDSRNYMDFDTFANACLNDYPEYEDDFTVAFRVLSTIIAQKTDEQVDSYEQGVIQLIKESSIPEESKRGLIGTVSVQKASKEFWYE